MTQASDSQGARVDERLRGCFEEVFPGLSADQIETAVRADMHEWDSLATLTLLTVVEEEFGLQFDDEEIAKFDSFASVRSLVEQGAE